MLDERDGILAIDIDLGRITAWSTLDGVVLKNGEALPRSAMLTHRTVLVETVSPYFYTDTTKPISRGETINRLKWAIFNAAMSNEAFNLKPSALFSPSSQWTLGHPEDIREMMAGCHGQYNHDIRACICMAFFYKHSPSKWIRWLDHLASIVGDSCETDRIERKPAKAPRRSRRSADP